MKYVFTSIFLILNILSTTLGNDLDYDGWLQIRLFHALNDDPVPHFTERGNLTVASIKTGASSTLQKNLDPSQIVSLQKLALNNKHYRLKALVRSSSNSETSFLTSVPACHLLGTHLEDILMIWLDGSGEPVSLTQVSPGPCSYSIPSTDIWTSSVQVRYPDGGPVPDTISYIYKLEREKEARERNETKDNRTFLAKYWMYIVPALIFIVLTSASNPDGGGAAR